MQDSIILEAEIVPYNESSREGGRGAGIEEFWHLGLAGIDASETGQNRVDDRYGQRNRDRHLCLVFFDVLHLDGESLFQSNYDERRKILERVVRTIPGFVSLDHESARIEKLMWVVDPGRSGPYTTLEGYDRSEKRELGESITNIQRRD